LSDRSMPPTFFYGNAVDRTPIISGGCARAASGHAAAAPPSAASNSRRPMVTVIRPSRARCVKRKDTTPPACSLLPPLLPPAALGERRHRGLARRFVAVRRRGIRQSAHAHNRSCGKNHSKQFMIKSPREATAKSCRQGNRNQLHRSSVEATRRLLENLFELRGLGARDLNHGILGGPGIPKCNPWVSPECARLYPGLFNKVPRPR